MARAQAQYLHIFDDDENSYYRWQSYYTEKTIANDGVDWNYVPFVADGLTAGISGDESNINITAPATSVVLKAFELAISEGYFAELLIYQFDMLPNNDEPPAEQSLVGAFIGQVVGGTAGLTSISLMLGSALSPVGAQIPPRKFTTAVMGKGCIL